jgi:putative hydrolase of the HAD superfamily
MPALVLDLGGVVYRSWPDDAFHERWATRLGLAAEVPAARLWQAPEWGEAELGRISEAQCYGAAAARLGIDAATFHEIVADAFFSRPDEALAAAVAGWRATGVATAALTNNTAGAAALMARPELARLFDFAISSADEGVAKPDAAMFRLAEARLGVSGGEIVFVDDVAMHLAAAAALGWRGVLFGETGQAIADIVAALAAAAAAPAPAAGAQTQRRTRRA